MCTPLYTHICTEIDSLAAPGSFREGRGVGGYTKNRDMDGGIGGGGILEMGWRGEGFFSLQNMCTVLCYHFL